MSKPIVKMKTVPVNDKKNNAKPKLRVASAKAGTAEKVDPNYFPPQNSVSHSEIVRIAESGETGIDVWDYKLSEAFLGKLVRCGLVDVNGGSLTATERCRGILDGSIERPSGSEFNQIMTALKKTTDKEEYAKLLARLGELGDSKVEQNVARATKE